MVLTTINAYTAKHPNLKAPDTLPRLVGLVARVKDSATIAAKRGLFFYSFFSFFLANLLSLSLAAISAANLRPERVKKTRAAVSPRSFSLSTLYSLFSLGKMPSSF